VAQYILAFKRTTKETSFQLSFESSGGDSLS